MINVTKQYQAYKIFGIIILGEDDKDDVGKESDDLEYGYQNYYL